MSQVPSFLLSEYLLKLKILRLGLDILLRKFAHRQVRSINKNKYLFKFLKLILKVFLSKTFDIRLSKLNNFLRHNSRLCVLVATLNSLSRTWDQPISTLTAESPWPGLRSLSSSLANASSACNRVSVSPQ